ncbi:MAG: helix-turn-helix domain-containing protein [Bacteroidetes bacterium]|nr:helix-turn-helix domain-containing protein [Bacteroidota bacterium]MBS1741023.1 helix-turn-helix domain-containing protein [Bacteroidota bacterium]
MTPKFSHLSQEQRYQIEALKNAGHSQLFCFGPTPKSINWFKSQEKNENIHFYEYGISNTNEAEFMNFYLPLNSNHVS